jgi:small subunit ribosomal protein S5
MAENRDNTIIDTVVNVNRVTKVTKGGKRFSFSALVVCGNKEGKVGIAIGKSREVSLAIAKATNKARKQMVTIPLRGTTIPYDVIGYHGASKVIIRPAAKGTGLIAGGAMRAVMEALGVRDILAKSLGSPNKGNVAKATLNALAQLRSVLQLAKQRGKTLDEMIGAKNVSA